MPASAYCLVHMTARWQVVVQRSASPCQLVMYESDLWAGGNGWVRWVRQELSVQINRGLGGISWLKSWAPGNPHWKTNNGLSRTYFANTRRALWEYTSAGHKASNHFPHFLLFQHFPKCQQSKTQWRKTKTTTCFVVCGWVENIQSREAADDM